MCFLLLGVGELEHGEGSIGVVEDGGEIIFQSLKVSQGIPYVCNREGKEG